MFRPPIVASLKLATIAGRNMEEATLFTIKKFTYFYMHVLVLLIILSGIHIHILFYQYS